MGGNAWDHSPRSDSLAVSWSSRSEADTLPFDDLHGNFRATSSNAESRWGDAAAPSSSGDQTPRKRKRTVVQYFQTEEVTAPHTPAKRHRAPQSVEPDLQPLVTEVPQLRRPNPYHQEAMMAVLGCAAAWAEAVDLLIKAREAARHTRANQRPKRRTAGLHPRNKLRPALVDSDEDEVEPIAVPLRPQVFTAAAPPVPLWSVS